MILSAEEFVKIRSSDDMNDQHRASHDEAPLHVWLEVINQFPEMKKWVAHNKTIPIHILEILARDSDSEVRCWVANKRKLTDELFWAFAKDSDASIRQRIACNAKAPLDVLQFLCTDLDPNVSNPAKEKLENRSQA